MNRDYLLDLATVLSLWVLALQLVFSTFGRDWLQDRYVASVGIDAANERLRRTTRNFETVVVLVLIASVVIGTLGLTRD